MCSKYTFKVLLSQFEHIIIFWKFLFIIFSDDLVLILKTLSSILSKDVQPLSKRNRRELKSNLRIFKS